LQLSGSVTIATANKLFNEGLKAQAGSSLVIDCGRLEKVDSSAVSLMLVWLREAQRSQVNLRFTNVPANLMSLATLYGVSDLMALSTAE
jgi:phospholipid transport system transporter-binding protein